MAINRNQIAKDAVLGHLTMTLIDNGFRVELCEQDGSDLYLYAAPRDARAELEDGWNYWNYWIKLVPGNGPDTLISDYSTNLEEIIKPSLDFAASFEE